MPAASPLVRQPRLSDQVAQQLRELIDAGKMRPGDSLPSERELCEHFSVSRTVIREAVKTLTAKGLVTSVPGSGLIVGTTTIEDVAEIFDFYFRGEPDLRYLDLHEVRYALEPAMCAQAAKNITDEQIAELLALCDELESLTVDDLVDASRNDAVFHRNIAVASQNSYFVIMLDALGRSLLDTRVATFSMDPQRLTTVAAAHRKIAEAIAAHDTDAAAESMREHLTEVVETWNLWTPQTE
ncbi:FadR/GntR family transcriptional regulator [Brachybacterium sp. AOP29-B2-41]|uniref:FadR/GntR family transcriptional regulator n=1 Tax=Brachybacterium sp. AOP29-B2-41 TaxID=3457704 RepID=UPI00403487C0